MIANVKEIKKKKKKRRTRINPNKDTCHAVGSAY